MFVDETKSIAIEPKKNPNIIFGALYLGFSIQNWTAKASLIGGIYNKPILIGNLLHFFTASMTLIKLTFKAETNLQLIFSYSIDLKK